MIPYDIFKLANRSQRLTDEEAAEHSQMKEYLDSITHAPASDFPWQRWKELSEKLALSNLPKGRPSKELALAIKDAYKELEKAEEQLRLWPITDANVDAQNVLMDQIERKQRQIEAALVMLKTMVADERELFGPKDTVSPATKPVVNTPKPHSLLALCLGVTQTERKGHSELINQMFDAAKQGVGYDTALYATAAVAVYKLAQHLRVVEQGTKATIWVALLQEQYGVTVTEGQAKYSFKTPTKHVFIKAVKAAYEVYSKRYPHKARGQQLPSGY
jgi:hypothetical protein